MTGNLSTDILVIYMPAALVVIMGILGILRGTRREVVVSGAITLASLITLVWGAPWAMDLHDMFPNYSAGDIRNLLVYVVMVLTVLVVGYLLGSALVPRTRVSPLSRLGGLVIGILNGLAIGGYFIRSQYESANLDTTGSNVDLINTITTNTISRSLWVWSNWFPLAVAIIAAIVAVIGPFRRAQTAVATPSADTNWGPATAPAVGTRGETVAPTAPIASPGPAAYTTGYGQGFTNQYPQQQPNQQYGHPAPPAFGGVGNSVPTTPARVQDAPPTMPMPASEMPRSTPQGGQGTAYFGTGGPPPTVQPTTPATSSEWSTYGNEPSWLTAPSSNPSSAQRPTESLPASHPAPDASTPSVDSSLVARSEAPTQSQPVINAPTPTRDTPTTTSDGTILSNKSSGPVTGPLNCPHCGAPVPTDATFCTECGKKLRS